MSRDVLYLVPSESEARNEQQASSSEPATRHRNESNASTASIDDNEHIDEGAEENIRPIIKEKVYYAAKDGLPIALTSLLSGVECDITRNAYINQVRKQNYHSLFLASYFPSSE